eukprot:COSAG02_NODE_3465_length_6695_cov_3.210734_4_plen_113_part_00
MIYLQARSTFLQDERTARKTFVEKARSKATRAFHVCTTTTVSNLSCHHRNLSITVIDNRRCTESMSHRFRRHLHHFATGLSQPPLTFEVLRCCDMVQISSPTNRLSPCTLFN